LDIPCPREVFSTASVGPKHRCGQKIGVPLPGDAFASAGSFVPGCSNLREDKGPMGSWKWGPGGELMGRWKVAADCLAWEFSHRYRTGQEGAPSQLRCVGRRKSKSTARMHLDHSGRRRRCSVECILKLSTSSTYASTGGISRQRKGENS
jgi:hypothetical protein